MLTFIFWTVVLSLFAASAYCWQEERKAREGERTLIKEIEAYFRRLGK